MPYSADHKARTRERIVNAARRLFNRRGFEQVSIDQVMAEAGMTRGGFYHHFASKDALYAEAVASFRSCNPFAVQAPRAKGDPRKLARLLVNLYLSDEVFDDPDLHCPLYALPSDVARAGLVPRQAYTEVIRNMTAIHRAALAPARDAARKAQTIVSLCVGGMVLARTTEDPVLRHQLRSAARQQALALLDSADHIGH